jgi:hypothetical protein
MIDAAAAATAGKYMEWDPGKFVWKKENPSIYVSNRRENPTQEPEITSFMSYIDSTGDPTYISLVLINIISKALHIYHHNRFLHCVCIPTYIPVVGVRSLFRIVDVEDDLKPTHQQGLGRPKRL